MSHQLRSKGKVNPSWIYHNSATELKKDILKRIDTFFQYEQHKNSFPIEHSEWETQALRRRNPTHICTLACDTFQLRSVRRTKGTQLSKSVQVLTPFEASMEAPVVPEEPPIVEVSSPSRSDILEPSRVTQSVQTLTTEDVQAMIEKHMQKQHTASTEIDVSEKVNEIEKQIETLSTSTDKIKDFIDNQLEKKIQNSIEEHSMNALKNIESRLTSVETNLNTRIDTAIQKVLQNDMQQQIQLQVQAVSKSVIKQIIQSETQEILKNIKAEINKIGATTKLDINKEIQGIRLRHIKELSTKETSSYKNMAQKRDDNILDIEAKHTQIIQELTVFHEDLMREVNDEAEIAIADIQTNYNNISSTPSQPSTNFKPTAAIPQQPFSSQPVTPTKQTKISTQPQPVQYTQQTLPQWQQQNQLGRWSTSPISSFHKQVLAKMSKESHVLNFYQQLYTQGPAYGIHFRPLEEIKMGVRICPDRFSDLERRQMATTLYQKMSDDDCVSPSFTKAHSLIRQYSSSSDGYKVLFQLLRSVHPNLQQITSTTYEVPKLSQYKGNLFDYGDQITHYILTQHIKQRQFDEIEQSIMFLNNIDVSKYAEAKQRALTEISHNTHPSNPGKLSDPNLQLDSLPTTIEQYQTQANTTSDSTNTNLIRTLVSDESTVVSETTQSDTGSAVLHYLRNNHSASNKRYNRRQGVQSQCKACGKWGCQEKRCSYTGRLKVALNFIQKNSKLASELGQEFLRINSKRTKMSTIRTLMSINPETNVTPDNELLQTYDVEIPMEEVEFHE